LPITTFENLAEDRNKQSSGKQTDYMRRYLYSFKTTECRTVITSTDRETTYMLYTYAWSHIVSSTVLNCHANIGFNFVK
jgi:hypothetical protein